MTKRLSLSFLILTLACTTEAPSDASLLDATDDVQAEASADTSVEQGMDATPIDASTDATELGQDAQQNEGCGVCNAQPPYRCDQCLDERLQEISAVVLDGKIVVVGGFEGSGAIVATMRIYDPQTNRWTTGPDLPQVRHHLQLAVVSGDLYALGGERDLTFSAVSRSWVLRQGASEWAEIAPTPRPRGAGFAAAFGTKIVIAGGQGEGRTDDEKMMNGAEVLIYDTLSDTWTLGAAIPTPREHVAGFANSDRLWIAGGRRISLQPTFDTVESYDPVSDTWTTEASLPKACGGCSGAMSNGQAFVTGGEENAGALNDVSQLDLATGQWSIFSPLPTMRHGHAMAAIGNRAYVIGGADAPIFASVDVVESFEF